MKHGHSANRQPNPQDQLKKPAPAPKQARPANRSLASQSIQHQSMFRPVTVDHALAAQVALLGIAAYCMTAKKR